MKSVFSREDEDRISRISKARAAYLSTLRVGK